MTAYRTYRRILRVLAECEKRGLSKSLTVVRHHHCDNQFRGEVSHVWSVLPSVMCPLRVVAEDKVLDVWPEINKK